MGEHGESHAEEAPVVLAGIRPRRWACAPQAAAVDLGGAQAARPGCRPAQYGQAADFFNRWNEQEALTAQSTTNSSWQARRLDQRPKSIRYLEQRSTYRNRVVVRCFFRSRGRGGGSRGARAKTTSRVKRRWERPSSKKPVPSPSRGGGLVLNTEGNVDLRQQSPCRFFLEAGPGEIGKEGMGKCRCGAPVGTLRPVVPSRQEAVGVSRKPEGPAGH